MKNRTLVIITNVFMYGGFIGLILSFFLDFPLGLERFFSGLNIYWSVDKPI